MSSSGSTFGRLARDGGGRRRGRGGLVRPGGRRALAGLVLVTAVAVSTAGCVPPPCTTAYPADLWEDLVTERNPWPAGSTPRPSRTYLFDTDGDRVQDTVMSVDGVVIVHRPGGDLVFTAPNGAVADNANSQRANDFDGDGRSEIEVDARRPGGGLDRYIVAGSTANGTYDVTDVGVRVAREPQYWGRAGDLDEDGADDLVIDLFTSVDVISGRALMATAPGAMYDGPSTYVGGTWIAPVPATATGDALVLIRDGDEIVVWLAGREVLFTTENSGLRPGNVYQLDAELRDGPDGQVWLRVNDSGGPPFPVLLGARWAWHFRTVCHRPAAA